ncbi:alpha/beta fold hydrolase [Glaciimonas sp. PAMC28666]|uniref:alpha/beta fold hydrolase n=1 Tax=Glaciimonas sp. PAMC28666 TaxID=2807626 RepID=UPI001963D05B|nr:alpha/beta hydrolase [Glaciimonas sp. PAMC28666]QRX82777.1 alpha/beta hydrolase [Glaciimonas sp. PAMC28666]
MNEAGFIEVDEIRLEYQRWPGSQPPIMLLHEALGSISIWRSFPAELMRATGHEVIAWSRHGHGDSDAPVGGRDAGYLEREAKLVPCVMDALAVSQAYLFGHSDGASIAIIAAALFPERVAGLVLEAPHVNVELRAIAGIIEATKAYASTDFRQKLQRHHRDVDHVFWAWHDLWTADAFQDWNIEQFLTAINVPTLVIQGVEDEYFSLNQVDLIVTAVPNAQRLVLADCGHSPHRDQQTSVLNAVGAFLSSASARHSGNAALPR